MNTLTKERLQELLDYNPATGEFIWTDKGPKCVKKGSVAGTISKLSDGTKGYKKVKQYRKIVLDKKAYADSKLAWLWHYGVLPARPILFLNRNTLDCRIENLTESEAPPKIKKASDITFEIVDEWLEYIPDTGKFFWKKSTVNGKALKGQEAGLRLNQGYPTVNFCGKFFLTHRLAWLLYYGYMPENEIDHINRVRGDNKIGNLREVSRTCNAANKCNGVTNTSGVKGVDLAKTRNKQGEITSKKWRVQIAHLGKKYGAGYYSDFDEAVCARLAVEQCLGTIDCNTDSPAYVYVKEKIQGC